MGFCFLLFVSIAGFALATETHAPHLDSANGGYRGIVNENELVVDVTPKIRAAGTEICNFRIVNKHNSEVPFEIVLKDGVKGEAELRAKRRLNCEKKKNYKFEIAAVSCDSVPSNNATVHVTVGDVNEFSPKFSQSSYAAEIDEGRLDASIIQVEAKDEDCSPKFGDICRYEILNKELPFTIDFDGNIRNTEPLDYSKHRNYIVRVVAYDCGMKRSDPVLVTIKVNRVCRLGWTGIEKQVNYKSGSGRLDLFPKAQLELCDVPCEVKSVQTKVTLDNNNAARNCDRDTYTVHGQHAFCEAHKDSIDLLPLTGPTSEWTKNLTVDRNGEIDQAFIFDGKSGVVVPAKVAPHSLTSNFSVGVWLKHENHPDQDKHVKEHIFCSADDHQMNRHHFSLFVRNCRLILLLRREFGDGDPKSYRPAEWRWKLPEICDGEWHHYALSMEFPNAQLFVDGQVFVADQNNPEIIDDWPLRSSHGLDTVFTVGACWQGSEGNMRHFMQGSMAGLSLLIGKTEDPDVFNCIHKCKENLEPPPIDLLQPGMVLLNNNDLTELTLEGDNKTNLEVMFQRIGYVNLKEFATAGRRPIRIQASIVCNSGRTLKIPQLDSEVSVEAAELPIISVTGSSSSHHVHTELQNGVRLFQDVRIDISSPDEDDDSSEEDDNDAEDDEETIPLPQKVESCSVSVYPPLNEDHESLNWPLDLAKKLKLEVRAGRNGLGIVGSDFTHHYEQILRQIEYRNQKPAYYLSRSFKLVCHQMNGRFVSNELQHAISVVHPESNGHSTANPQPVHEKHITEEPLHHLILEDSKSFSPSHARRDQHHVDFNAAESLSDTTAEAASSSNSLAIALILCMGALILAAVLGILRMRTAKRRAQEEAAADTEMAWDDTALTITVNPLEQRVVGPAKEPVPVHGVAEVAEVAGEDSDSDSDDNSNYDSNDEDGGSYGKLRDLEWDNSTLNI